MISYPQQLKIVAAFSDRRTALECAESHDATLISATAESTGHLPFDSLLTCVTDDVESVIQAADIGAWLVCERTIKSKPLERLAGSALPGSVGIFPLVANPGLGRKSADEHWRDRHAPLALRVHSAMTHYYQLSVQHRLKGPDWHGFALCCFANEDDLRHRFFDDDEGERAVGEDVAYFADTRQSPRRVVAGIIRHGGNDGS